MSSNNFSGSGGLISLTDDNKLVMGKMSSIELDVRNWVTFGLFLVNNYEASKIIGNGGWGNDQELQLDKEKMESYYF